MGLKIGFILLAVSANILWGQNIENEILQNKPSSELMVDVFPGIIYKYVDFSNSAIIGQNTEANMQVMWDNDAIKATFSPNPNDKILIIDNDTIWSCMLPGDPSANLGVQYNGQMQLNGTDSSDDTLTYVCFTYFIRLDENFDWSKGGKQPGLAGSNRPGCKSPVPSGGLYAPFCGQPENETYGDDAGFSARFARQSLTAGGENELGIYLYHHDLDWKNCDKKTYGFNMNMETRSDTAYNTGQWYRMTERLILNSVPSEGTGIADGILELYKDDILVAKKTDVVYRKYSDIYIDLYYLATLTQFDADRNSNSFIWYDDFFLWADDDRSEHEIGYVLTVPEASFDHRNLNKNDNIGPTIPANLKVSAITQNSISISWDPSTDNVAVAGYRIFVDNSLISAINGTEYEIKGLISGKEYTITVSSYDAASNESKKSTPINAKTLELDTEPPTVPSGIELSNVTAVSLEFNWQPSEDNTGVDHYEVRLNGTFKAFTDKINYVASGLSPNTNYAITLRAIDEAGNFSPFSEAVTWRTEVPDEQSPSKPVGLKAEEVTKQSIQLKWNPAIDNVAVSSYNIHVNNDVMAESTVNEEKIEGLKAGLTYVISVSALDEAGNESEESDTIHVTTPNNDFTTRPTMAEVSIVELHTESTNPSSLSEMKSLGHVELESFGIIVTQGTQFVEEGSQIFAEKVLTNVDNKGRVTDGLQLLYNFSNKQGNKVSEISGVGEPLDLFINRPQNTTWLPGQGLKVNGNTTLIYEGTPTRLINALKSTNEITIEAWISQFETEQTGPARIVTLSDGDSSRAVTLGHEGNKVSYNYVTRLQTTNTDSNGLPEFATLTNFTNNSLHHLVYTRTSKGIEKLFVNGIELSSGDRGGDFSSWTGKYKFALGNELSGERPWNGVYYLVAIYNRALSSDAIIQNYQTGFGTIRYTTELSELKFNTSYILYPFVKTDQGIVYGEKKSFLIENVLFSEGDSIYMAVYPNPSNGDFKLHVEYENSSPQKAFLRIADLSGKIILSRELKFNDEFVNTEIDINLQHQIAEGIYSALLIVGNKAIAQKIVIY